MNLRRQLLVSAALLGVSGAIQAFSLISGLSLSASFPWNGLITVALAGGTVIGLLLQVQRGSLSTPDWRASWPLYLLPTLAVLIVGGLLIDRWQVQHTEQLSLRAFRDLTVTPSCPAVACIEAEGDGALLTDLLQSAITDAGGRVAGGALPLTRQGDRVQGETQVTLRVGLRQVPFTLRYGGPVIVNRTSALPVGGLTPAQATLERAHD